MKPIYVTEPGASGGIGAMGMRIMLGVLRRAGYRAVRVAFDKAAGEAEQTALFAIEQSTVVDSTSLAAPSAWFVSLLNARQFWELPDLFRRMGLPLRAADRSPSDPLVAFGGSAMLNPEPVADFADLIALGDGEITAPRVAALLYSGASKGALMAELHGTPGFWCPPLGVAKLARVNGTIGDPLVQPDMGAGRYAIEIARGCRHRCAFCTIGWTHGAYREAAIEQVRSALERVRGRAANIFAPDTSAVTFMGEIASIAAACGVRNTSRDSRIDSALASYRNGAAARPLSFGVEGLSERLRRAVGKPIANAAIVETMSHLERAGVGNTKWFVILALPGETDADADEFLELLSDVRRVYNGRLDIAMTHLHGLPHTPLQWIDGHYSDEANARYERIWEWSKERNIAGRLGPQRGCEIYYVNWTKRPTHDSDGYLYRAGREGSLAIEAANSVQARVKDGRWSAPVDAESVLRARGHTEPLPWDHVDVGRSKRMLAAGWAAYNRRLGNA